MWIERILTWLGIRPSNVLGTMKIRIRCKNFYNINNRYLHKCRSSRPRLNPSSLNFSWSSCPIQPQSSLKPMQQQHVIQQLTRVSRGLFHPNPAVSVNGAIKSGQLYNSGLKVSTMMNAMKQHDLVLRVSVTGEHNACAMATHEDLASNAVISSPSGSPWRRGEHSPPCRLSVKALFRESALQQTYFASSAWSTLPTR